MTLKEQLDAYLSDTKGSWTEIARQCGVDRWWIYKYVAGGIDNPGIERVEKILNHAKANGWTPKEAA